MSTTNGSTVLATATILDTDWRRVINVFVAGTLIPAVLGAPLLQWAFAPQLDGFARLVGAFQGLLFFCLFLTGTVVVVLLMQSGPGHLKRTVARIDVFQHGVELRGGDGAVLADTASGGLRVANVNLRSTSGMLGGLRLDHPGVALRLSPTPSIAPWPGEPAVEGPWYSVSQAVYEGLRRFAA